MAGNRWSEHTEEITQACHELAAASVVEDLDLGGEDEQLWADCDLASFAENRLGERIDPRTLDASRRADLGLRATTEAVYLPSSRDYQRCFWLLDEGQRCGSMALDRFTLGGTSVRASSLYVFPAYRGRGTGRAALSRACEALGRRGLELRLDTSWTWQPAVRSYLRMGMWLYSWKRDLDYRWDLTRPAPILDVGRRRARLSVVVCGRRRVLASARRESDRLVLDERPHRKEDPMAELRWDANTTLALHLALHGWPLIRSREDWERCRLSDAGAPEALAYKIVIWEAWDRAHGWRVETPRIPGLEYRTWAELVAGWEAEEARLAERNPGI